jgi:hypothetical protein
MLRLNSNPNKNDNRSGRLIHLIGRRGFVIILLSIIEITLGSATIATPQPLYQNLAFVTLVSPSVWGGIQILLGVLALIFAPLRTGRDKVGFQLLFIPPMIWGFAYLGSVILGDWPLDLVSGLRATVIWAGYGLMILIVSGMIGVEELQDYLESTEKNDLERG